jgi:hypothetical protein
MAEVSDHQRIGLPSPEEAPATPSDTTKAEVDFWSLTPTQRSVAQYERELDRLLKVVDILRYDISEERKSSNQFRDDYHRANTSLARAKASLADMRWDTIIVITLQTLGGVFLSTDLRKIEDPDWAFYFGVIAIGIAYLVTLCKGAVKPLAMFLVGLLFRWPGLLPEELRSERNS